ncbi:MAG: DUF2442 domain-containing protein [Clostridia bacterium]|nr:DUF2442 domain-containing protein [Clostridia bacterium]
MRTLPPDAVSVTVIDNHTLHIIFSNGEQRLFDIKPLLTRKCYAQLNNKAFLAQAFVENGCVTWPGGIDIDPDWLYDDSVSVQALSCRKALECEA